MMPSDYLDIGPAIAGGYRVARVKKQDVIRAYVLIETALDAAAAARLCGLPVLSSEPPIIEACRALGVAIVAPPPQNKNTFFERHE